MRISAISTALALELVAISSLTVGFSPLQGNRHGRIVQLSTSPAEGPCSSSYRRHCQLVRLQAEKTESDGSSVVTVPKKVEEIGLLTFDLDDTLFPIAPVVEDANGESYFL